MEDLRDLYQQVIVDHSKNPRNFGKLEGTRHWAKGHNPLCGDKVTVYLVCDGDKIVDVKFDGSGCAISTASASMMTQVIKGKTVEEIKAMFGEFRELVTKAPSEEALEKLGKLAVFGGVSEYPMRVKCATLAWHTLQNALKGDSENEAKTE